MRKGARRAGDIEGGVSSTAPQKAVIFSTDLIVSHHLPAVINPVRFGESGAGDIQGGVGATAQQKAAGKRFLGLVLAELGRIRDPRGPPHRILGFIYLPNQGPNKTDYETHFRTAAPEQRSGRLVRCFVTGRSI